MTLTAQIIEISDTLGLLIYTMRVDVGGVATVHVGVMVDAGAYSYVRGINPFTAASGEAFMRAFMEEKLMALCGSSFTVEV